MAALTGPALLATWLAACGSGGPGAPHGGATGGRGGGPPDAMFVRVDGGPPPSDADAGLALSCGGAGDAGVTCIEFDPGYPSPADACAALGDGVLVDSRCTRQASAGGCHVVEGASGYTVWSYAPQTIGAAMLRCLQLGQSYVSSAADGRADGGS